MRYLITALTAASALGLAACSSSPPEQLPPQPASVDNTPAPTPTPAGPTPGTNEHFVAQLDGRNVIYFDTDMFDIDAEDANRLRAQAEYLQAYPNTNATIEGHTDERGTRDYNLALGERRANAAKNYLVGLGIDASRLSTVSYGKERPVAVASTEEAWAQNRRAVTILIN